MTTPTEQWLRQLGLEEYAVVFAQQRVDLCEVVESTLPMLRREAKYRGRLTTELGDVPPVLGDPRPEHHRAQGQV